MVQSLAKDEVVKFQQTQRHFPGSDLVFQKGTYCYEYMDSRDKFEETKLPPRDHFYSHLKEDDYAHAQMVWNEFNIQNPRQYHELYLTLDVLLLADVFENFRCMSLNYYELDPCHYYTLPGLSFDACLKMTKIELELLCEPEQFLFDENSIRGVVSVVSHRRSIANNEFVPNYKPNDTTSWILFVDANNLYGHAMSQPLPTGHFKFLSPREIEEFNMSKTAATDDVEFILEVNLKYPVHLHESHNDYRNVM